MSKKAFQIFTKAGGILRMSEAIRKGINPKDFYQLRLEGKIKELTRGLYCWKNRELAYPDFAIISKKIPDGIICLISALDFHELTTEIPHFIYIAIDEKAYRPKIEHPPIRYFWAKDKFLKLGVEKHFFDGCSVSITNKEKTIVDCFKYRNKIGLDVALEALQYYLSNDKPNLEKLLKYAKICRVSSFMKPILQAMLKAQTL